MVGYMKGPVEYWLDKLLTRGHFVRPLLNAAMFSWLMASLSLLQYFFGGFDRVVIRWVLTGLIFLFSFWLYIYWDEADEVIENEVDEKLDE